MAFQRQAMPKGYAFEPATRFPLTSLGGSLISIVVYRDGDDLGQAKHVLQA
jgi:hypothetical protein